MMHYMNLKEVQQPNMGRVQLDIQAFVEEVRRNNGRIHFDSVAYRKYVDEEARANEPPEVEQFRRPKLGSPSNNIEPPLQQAVEHHSMQQHGGQQDMGYFDGRGDDFASNHYGRGRGGRGRGRGRGRGGRGRGRFENDGGRFNSGGGRSGDGRYGPSDGHYGPVSSIKRERSPSHDDSHYNSRRGDDSFRRGRGGGRGGRGRGDWRGGGDRGHHGNHY